MKRIFYQYNIRIKKNSRSNQFDREYVKHCILTYCKFLIFKLSLQKFFTTMPESQTISRKIRRLKINFPKMNKSNTGTRRQIFIGDIIPI